ncbi:cupin domain-containing protein [Fluviicola sp.]|uniref:cupin domain-containing protein n=1 Tax=Fluviicola sp. TaxID=1917219 RepID=UPI0031D0BBBD
MATDLYAGFTNPNAGETFRCISNDAEAFVFEWIVQPGGHVPNPHIHFTQDELFHIKSGEIRMVLDGKEYIGKAGDSINATKGASHIAYNNTPEILTCVVEFRPALDSFKFFQCMGGLVLDKDYDKNGQVNIPKMCYFMKRMKAKSITRPTNIPAPIFKIVLNLFYMKGIILGWNKYYKKYTE